MSIFHSDNTNTRLLDISWAAISKVGLVVCGVYIVYLIKDILLLVLFALTLSVLFGPAISFFHKLGIARPLAVAFVYIVALAFIGLLAYSVTPILRMEISQFSLYFPVYFEKVAPFLSGLGFDIFNSMDAFAAAAQGWFVAASSNILNSLAGIFGGIMLGITVFTMSVFFSAESGGVEKMISLLFPKKHENKALEIWRRTQTQISGWFGTRLAGAFIQGLLVAVACTALRIDYPILLGCTAFGLGIVPFIGSLTSGTIITAFALLASWEKALAIAVLCVIISQIKNNFVIPVLSKKYTELPTSLVLVSLLVGERLWGVLGAILAIPMFGILFDFTRDYLEKNKD